MYLHVNIDVVGLTCKSNSTLRGQDWNLVLQEGVFIIDKKVYVRDKS